MAVQICISRTISTYMKIFNIISKIKNSDKNETISIISV